MVRNFSGKGRRGGASTRLRPKEAHVKERTGAGWSSTASWASAARSSGGQAVGDFAEELVTVLTIYFVAQHG